MRTLPVVPTLSQMVREGSESAIRIKRASKDALVEWLAQSERLVIARTHYKLRGKRFVDFARRIDIDRASAFQLVKLWPHRTAILSRCQDEGRYYGWQTCLYWFEKSPRRDQALELRRANKRIAALERRLEHRDDREPDPNAGRYWLTPPKLYRALDAEFHFTFDPCPYPRPSNFDGLAISWGARNYVNAPFKLEDALNGRGITDFARKAIEEQQKGNTSVLLIPTNAVINLLLEAGAEVRSMGRVPWVDVDTGEAWSSPHPVTAFILRGSRLLKRKPVPTLQKPA